MPEKPNILLDGFINITPKKYDVKLALKNAFSVPVTTDGLLFTLTSAIYHFGHSGLEALCRAYLLEFSDEEE